MAKRKLDRTEKMIKLMVRTVLSNIITNMDLDSDASPSNDQRLRHREAPRTKGTCDRCALSKVKCDRQQPHCARCVAIGEDLGISPPCHYTVSLRSLKRRIGGKRGKSSRLRSSTTSTQSSAAPATPEPRSVDWATNSSSDVFESDGELESDNTFNEAHPFGTFSLSTRPCMAYPQPLSRPSTKQEATTRPACMDLIHSCVRDMMQTTNTDSCTGSRSPKGTSVEQFLALSRRLAETFNTITACTCTEASSSAFPVAYLLSTAFQMFRSAVESLLPKRPTIAQRREYRSRLLLLRTELEKMSKLGDSFNTMYCQNTSQDVGQCQLLKYRLSMDLKHCLDDLDERAGCGG